MNTNESTLHRQLRTITEKCYKDAVRGYLVHSAEVRKFPTCGAAREYLRMAECAQKNYAIELRGRFGVPHRVDELRAEASAEAEAIIERRGFTVGDKNNG